MGQRPVDVFLRFGFEAGVVEQVGEGDEAIEEVGAAFPGFSGATEPAAVGADVGPGFVEVSAEAVGLNLQLVAQPAGWANGAERERIEGAWLQGRAVAEKAIAGTVFRIDGLCAAQRQRARHRELP